LILIFAAQALYPFLATIVGNAPAMLSQGHPSFFKLGRNPIEVLSRIV
jgi:hypothetical protein